MAYIDLRDPAGKATGLILDAQAAINGLLALVAEADEQGVVWGDRGATQDIKQSAHEWNATLASIVAANRGPTDPYTDSHDTLMRWLRHSEDKVTP